MRYVPGGFDHDTFRCQQLQQYGRDLLRGEIL